MTSLIKLYNIKDIIIIYLNLWIKIQKLKNKVFRGVVLNKLKRKYSNNFIKFDNKHDNYHLKIVS